MTHFPQSEPAPHVEPLAAPIESTLNHDPYINSRFIEMMEHEDNAQIVRAMTVGLPINDPAKPVEPAEEEKGALETTRTRSSNDPLDAMVGTDVDGDKLNMAYNAAKRAIFIKTSPRGYYLPIGKVPGMVQWLLSRKAKSEGKTEVDE